MLIDAGADLSSVKSFMGVFPEIEKKLYHWFLIKHKAGVMIDGPILKAKAKDFWVHEEKKSNGSLKEFNFKIDQLILK